MRAQCVVCLVRFHATSRFNACCSEACATELRGDFTARFWRRVDTNGPVAPGMRSSCWLWTGRLETSGYARIKRDKSRQQVSVHRAAWELRNGPIPVGRLVLHRCDVRHCVRHLYLGTTQNNTDDMLRRGRANKAKGAAHGQAKLTEDDARALLRLRGEGWTLQELADKFGIGNMQASRICSGKRWSHLQG